MTIFHTPKASSKEAKVPLSPPLLKLKKRKFFAAVPEASMKSSSEEHPGVLAHTTSRSISLPHNNTSDFIRKPVTLAICLPDSLDDPPARRFQLKRRVSPSSNRSRHQNEYDEIFCGLSVDNSSTDESSDGDNDHGIAGKIFMRF
jgi:hypothetical protein